MSHSDTPFDVCLASENNKRASTSCNRNVKCNLAKTLLETKTLNTMFLDLQVCLFVWRGHTHVLQQCPRGSSLE